MNHLEKSKWLLGAEIGELSTFSRHSTCPNLPQILLKCSQWNSGKEAEEDALDARLRM